jgi:hypothetical protein
MVYVLHSDWLAGLFSAESFVNGKPGDFTVQYNVEDGKTSAYIIAIGDNP